MAGVTLPHTPLRTPSCSERRLVRDGCPDRTSWNGQQSRMPIARYPTSRKRGASPGRRNWIRRCAADAFRRPMRYDAQQRDGSTALMTTERRLSFLTWLVAINLFLTVIVGVEVWGFLGRPEDVGNLMDQIGVHQ